MLVFLIFASPTASSSASVSTSGDVQKRSKSLKEQEYSHYYYGMITLSAISSSIPARINESLAFASLSSRICESFKIMLARIIGAIAPANCLQYP